MRELQDRRRAISRTSKNWEPDEPKNAPRRGGAATFDDSTCGFLAAAHRQGVRRHMMRVRRVMAICGRFADRSPVVPRRDDESVIWIDPYGRTMYVEFVTRGSTKRRDCASFLT